MLSLTIGETEIPDDMICHAADRSWTYGDKRLEVELLKDEEYEHKVRALESEFSNGAAKATFEPHNKELKTFTGADTFNGFAYRNTRFSQSTKRMFIVISDKIEGADESYLGKRASAEVAKLHSSYSDYKQACERNGIPESEQLSHRDYIIAAAPIYAAFRSPDQTT